MHPIYKNFIHETCIECKQPAKLIRTKDLFRWRCCGRSWITEDSVMDHTNELLNDDDYLTDLSKTINSSVEHATRFW